MPRQLIACATFSPEASCRRLLIGAAILLLCLPLIYIRVAESFQGWDCMGTSAASDIVQDSFPFFSQEKLPFTGGRDSGGFSNNVGHAKSFTTSTEASAQVHLKRFHGAPPQAADITGGGQSAPYERSSTMFSRGRRKKNAIR